MSREISPFSTVFKRPVLQTSKKQGFFGKGVKPTFLVSCLWTSNPCFIFVQASVQAGVLCVCNGREGETGDISWLIRQALTLA